LVYTYGQRHGFTIHTRRTDSGPLYVVGKDTASNTITVDTVLQDVNQRNHDETYTLSDAVLCVEVDQLQDVQCQIRYRGSLYDCHIHVYDTGRGLLQITVVDLPQPVAVGQSIVLYDGEYCVGGGVVS